MARHERYWAEYVKAYHQGGLSVVAFCGQNNLNTKTFYKWLKRHQDGLKNTHYQSILKGPDSKKSVSNLKAADAKTSVSKSDSKSLHSRFRDPYKIPSKPILPSNLPQESGFFVPVQLVDTHADDDGKNSSKNPSKSPVTLHFKTKGFCLDVELNLSKQREDLDILLQSLSALALHDV